MPSKPPTRADIVREARSLLGTPYMHLQRGEDYCDCVGLLIVVARRFGLGDYRRRDYSRIPDPEQMTRELKARLDPVDPGKVRPGDILWFAFWQRLRGRKYTMIPRHVGIAGDYPGGGLSVIHAYAEAGKVVEHRLDTRWRKRIYGAFSFRGVID